MILRIIKIHRFGFAVICCIAVLLLIYLYHINSLQYLDNLENGKMKYVSPANTFLAQHTYVDLRELLMAAIQAAHSGGKEVVAIAQGKDLHERSKGKTDQGANDPVTLADQLSHCAMKQGLQHLFPLITIHSEEDAEHCTDNNTFVIDPMVKESVSTAPRVLVPVANITVWLDPLDATQEYIEQLYEYVTTMSCVAVNGKPVIGVIHKPFTGKTAWVWVGKIASDYLNSLQPSRVQSNILNEPIITVSRSHSSREKEVVSFAFGPDATIMKAAGAGYKVLQVVSNNATLYLHTTKIKKWDICAGDAILRHLHGRMVTLDNDLLDYSSGTTPVNAGGLIAVLNSPDYFIKEIVQYWSDSQRTNYR